MALTDFNLAHPNDGDDHVAVYAHDGWQTVITVIPLAHLRELVGVDSLAPSEAESLVRQDLLNIERIVRTKYERGEFRKPSAPSSSPCFVYLRLHDLTADAMNAASTSASSIRSLRLSENAPDIRK